MTLTTHQTACENNLPNNWMGEVFGMKLWGKIRFNERRRLYFVDGQWQGKRYNLYSIPTRSGFLSCKYEDMARHLQLEISREVSQGIFNPARYKRTKPLHLAGYAEHWLKIKKPNLAYKTWEGYRGRIRLYIAPLLGTEYLPYINHEKLQIFVNELKAAGLSLKSRKNCYALLYQILGDAHKSGHIPQIPAPIPFQSEVRTIEWLTMEQQEAILAEIPERHRYIFRFIFATGCRPSEARALRKKDIREDRIDIKRTFAPGPGGQVLGIVKNKREQAIPLYAEVATLLEDMPKHLSPFVFVNPDTGGPYTKNINRDWWNPACIKVLGHPFPLKNAGRHSLGHQILAAGGSLEDAMNALRHSNISVTKRFYARPSLKVVGGVVDGIRKRKVD